MGSARASKILLIGWDAADWKILSPLIDQGQMPALAAIIEHGCLGNIATLQPMLSPILWTSIVTGKRAAKHGIHGFVEPAADGRGIRPVSSTSRTCKAIWNICNQSGLKSHAVGFFASHPAEPLNGVCVSNQFSNPPPHIGQSWPVPAGSVHPARLIEAVSSLRVHPSEITSSDLTTFIPNLSKIDRDTDRRPGELAKILAKAVSTQAVFTSILEHESWNFAAVYFDAIDHVSHRFMPYHAPKMEGINDSDYENYKDVINAVYRFHDLMLARQLALAGPDTTVILLSDHGFHSDHLRPQFAGQASSEMDEAALDAAWHRPLGVIAMAGPGIRQDERIYGANLLDVVPTILALLGLPLGRDMDGKVLASAISGDLQLERIDTWETVPGDAGTHPSEFHQQEYDHAQSLQQLVELGYIDPLSEDDAKNVTRAKTEAAYNLAVSQLEAARPSDALPLIRPLYDGNPAEARFATVYAQALQMTGRVAEAALILEKLVEADASTPDADLLLAAARFNTGRTAEAIESLQRIRTSRPGDVRPHLMLGSAMNHLRKWPDAEAAFAAALGIDEANHEALDGLSVALFSQQKFVESADAALRAVGILHHFPMAHLHLGMALFHLGEEQRATQPLLMAVAMQPRLLDAHRYLATIYRRQGHRDLALKHRQKAEELIAQGVQSGLPPSAPPIDDTGQSAPNQPTE